MEEQGQEVIETRMGTMPLDRERIVKFPRGLIGFEEYHEFILLQIHEQSPFMLLQSLDDPQLGLIVTDPYVFVENFKVKIGSAEQKILQAGDIEEMAVLVTVAVPQGRPEHTTLNLTGPIVINSATKTGLQVPQMDPDSPAHIRIGKVP